jgi:hypothetical protein
MRYKRIHIMVNNQEIMHDSYKLKLNILIVFHKRLKHQHAKHEALINIKSRS